MNKIVFEHYPASKLPDDMRAKVDADGATVTIEVTVDEKPPETVMSLDEVWALRKPPFRSKEEIDAEWRKQRDEWE